MAFRQRRQALRSILNGSGCIRPGSVYDATSIRIAEDLGFEVGMFGGSVASLAVLGDPDIALITLTELCEQMRRMSRAAVLPVLVDADHGYGNALNVRRTVQELEAAGAAGLTIEDTLLPQAFGQASAAIARSAAAMVAIALNAWSPQLDSPIDGQVLEADLVEPAPPAPALAAAPAKIAAPAMIAAPAVATETETDSPLAPEWHGRLRPSKVLCGLPCATCGSYSAATEPLCPVCKTAK